MAKMSKLNSEATGVFFTLIDGLLENGAFSTFDKHNYLPERSGGIMSVHVECIGKNRYSVAHYYDQNGDLMSDPQMTFWVCGRNVFPCSYTLHSFGRFEVSTRFDENEMPVEFCENLQKGHANFADFWMMNIEEQQDI